MVKHEGTLDNYGQDPTDPMAKNPVGADISLATYGTFWKYQNLNGAMLAYELDRSAFDYNVYSGIAPDAFGAYTDFGYQTYFIWLVAQGNVVIDYTRNNINSWLVIENVRQHILPLCAYGFRIRNSVLGSNIPYQLVIFR